MANVKPVVSVGAIREQILVMVAGIKKLMDPQPVPAKRRIGF